MGYDELLDRVRSLLRQAIEARYEAGPHTDKVFAQAYADGYMRALSEARLLTDDRLLELVLDERKHFLDGEQPVDEALAS